MKNSSIVFTVVNSTEGGYEARAIGHSIFTQAETILELEEMVREAVRCHFDSEPLPDFVPHYENPRSSA